MSEIEIINGTKVNDKQIRRGAEIYVDAWRKKLVEEYCISEYKKLVDKINFYQSVIIETFPEGQIFAVHDNETIGTINTLRVPADMDYLKQGWNVVTGGLDLSPPNRYPDNSNGDCLLCIAIQTDRKSSVRGAARKIIEHIKELGKEWDINVWTYSTLMSYDDHRLENDADLESFVREHRVVSFHKHMGAKLGGVIPNGRGSDPICIMHYRDLPGIEIPENWEDLIL